MEQYVKEISTILQVDEEVVTKMLDSLSIDELASIITATNHGDRDTIENIYQSYSQINEITATQRRMMYGLVDPMTRKIVKKIMKDTSIEAIYQDYLKQGYNDPEEEE